MEFNIRKYDNTKFHENELTHKRIKALLLWFEYEVYKKDLNYLDQVKFMDKLMKRLVSFEYYEVVPFFKKKRTDMMITYNKSKRVKMSEGETTESFLIKVQNKIIELYRRIKK